MKSIIKLHAISGAMGEGALCYILEIDDFRFLLESGWDEKFGMDHIEELNKYIHKVDCVLISHSDIYHLGALPYLIGKLGLSSPIYATIPTFKMGQMCLYDWYLNRQSIEDFRLFNLDDVDSAFDRILQLEYNLPVHLNGKGAGITITALPAGHTLGGSSWKISKTGESDIFYAIDHNNKKERHLNGFEIEKMTTIHRPGIFITNALNALYIQEKRRKRDELLLGTMQETLRSGGNVLVGTDTAGRALELILMIDQMSRLRESGLVNYSLVFLNNVAFNVLEFAKSQVEWMSEKLIKAFETTKTNPFQLKNVVLCHTLIELSQIGSPKVVITSSADLECGFARDLFLQWCQDPRSSVILTHRTSPGTLARTLIDGLIPRGRKMELEVRQRVKLEGKELEGYYLKKMLNEKKRRWDALEDSDEELQTKQEDMESVFKLNNNNHHVGSGKKRRFDDYEVNRAEDSKENERTSSATEDEPPTKIQSEVQSFAINCRVEFIDFEGRSDVESVLKMLQEIQPKQLVLVRGTPQSTLALDNLAQKLLPNTKIYKPSLRKVLNLSSGEGQIQVKLMDSLASSLHFFKVRDVEVAWVDGVVKSSPRTDDLQSTLQIQPSTPPHHHHPPCVVNRVRLRELCQILRRNGISCEIKGQALHCLCPDGVVYIAKDPSTKSIHIECDGLPEEYYKIRGILYDQMAFLF